MDYLINENKLRQLVFNLLDNSQLKHCDESGPWSTGGIPYYVWDVSEDDPEYFDPEIGFVYYDHLNSYEFNDTYEDNMFPLVEILEPYCTQLTSAIPKNLFLKHATYWFEKQIGNEVKTVSCG